MAYRGESILKSLKLTEYYPSLLSYKEATTIRCDETTDENPRNGLMLVSHLLKCDRRQLEDIPSMINISMSSAKDAESSYTLSTEPQQFSYQRKRAITSENSMLNPMDVLTVILRCCDDLLRQILIEKLVSVKVSVPIILNPVKQNGIKKMVLSWSLKGIASEKFTEQQNKLIKIPNPILSFIRIGNLHRSKSKLLSDLLIKNGSWVFYHRECQSGSAKRVVSNGSVEVSWFQSTPDVSEVDYQFNCNLFTILNLRGDAKEFPMQTKLICESSSLLVIMTDSIDSLSSWHDNVQNEIDWKALKIVIAVVSPILIDHDIKIDSFMKTCSFRDQIIDIGIDSDGYRQITFMEWRTNFREVIEEFIAKDGGRTCLKIPLEKFIRRANSLQFQIEEDNEKFKFGKFISDVFESCMHKSVSSRSKLFKLQKEPLKTLAEFKKQLLRDSPKENETTENFVKRLQDGIKRERAEQLQIIQSFSAFEKEFYRLLQNQQNDDFMIALLLIKFRHDGCQIDKIKSFNVETIVRELGQMYEAVHFESNLFLSTSSQIRDFALRAAELLLLGQPLELLNGEASYIPIAWIKEVFRRVEELTGNGKVFLLSVIGVQSSGKSTLLNTLFGLNFPTSAGKCTSGVYCHLIPIEKTSIKCECDFVMILDAEGFRAPEHVKIYIERDNEMATFIVGVSDLTIVNVDGENWSDMKDILQIVVFALLRIKQAKRKIEFMPSCIFVHQKISASDFRDRTKSGNETQLKYLDEMVKASANREGYINIESLSDVVDYNYNTDSFFLPNMWLGNPPFATVSSDYSQAVAKVKSHLMKKVETWKHCLNFTDLFLRINDLWSAILQENFVFNFTDTKQVLAYESLSSAFSKIERDFRIAKLKIVTSIVNTIGSSEDSHYLSQNEESLMNELESKIKAIGREADSALKTLFLSTPHKDVIEMLRETFEARLDSLKNEMYTGAKYKMEIAFKTHAKKLQKFEAIKSKHISAMKSLVNILRSEKSLGKGPENAKKYEETFSAEKQHYEESIKKAKNDIESTVRKLLPIDARKLYDDKQYGSSIPEVTEKDIEEKEFKRRNTPTDSVDQVPAAALNELLKDTFRNFRMSIELLDGLDFEESEVVTTLFTPIAEIFGIRLTGAFHEIPQEKSTWQETESSVEQNSKGWSENHGSFFKKDFIARFLAAVGHQTYDILSIYKIKFIDRTDAYVDIRRRYFRIVEDTLKKGEEPEFMLARNIIDCVENQILEGLSLIIDKMMKEDANIVWTKRGFMQKVFTSFAEEPAFLRIYEALTNFTDFTKKELESYVQNFWNDDNNRSAIVNCLDTEKKVLIKKVKDDISSSFVACGNDRKQFLEILAKQIAGKIEFRTDSASIVILGKRENDHTLKSLHQIVNHLQSSLDILSESDLSEKINSHFVSSKENCAKETFNEIFSGCEKKCPFCLAPCLERSQIHTPHAKHNSLHYPIGVRGGVQHTSGFFTWLHKTVNPGKNNSLVLESCPSLIQSNKRFRSDVTMQKYTKWYHKSFSWLGADSVKYRDYQQEFPDWHIPKLSEMKENENDYWKWLMANFGSRFAEKHGVKCPNISRDWTAISKDKAAEGIRIGLRNPNTQSRY